MNSSSRINKNKKNSTLNVSRHDTDQKMLSATADISCSSSEYAIRLTRGSPASEAAAVLDDNRSQVGAVESVDLERVSRVVATSTTQPFHPTPPQMAHHQFNYKVDIKPSQVSQTGVFVDSPLRSDQSSVTTSLTRAEREVSRHRGSDNTAGRSPAYLSINNIPLFESKPPHLAQLEGETVNPKCFTHHGDSEVQLGLTHHIGGMSFPASAANPGVPHVLQHVDDHIPRLATQHLAANEQLFGATSPHNNANMLNLVSSSLFVGQNTSGLPLNITSHVPANAEGSTTIVPALSTYSSHNNPFSKSSTTAQQHSQAYYNGDLEQEISIINNKLQHFTSSGSLQQQTNNNDFITPTNTITNSNTYNLHNEDILFSQPIFNNNNSNSPNSITLSTHFINNSPPTYSSNCYTSANLITQPTQASTLYTTAGYHTQPPPEDIISQILHTQQIQSQQLQQQQHLIQQIQQNQQQIQHINQQYIDLLCQYQHQTQIIQKMQLQLQNYDAQQHIIKTQLQQQTVDQQVFEQQVIDQLNSQIVIQQKILQNQQPSAQHLTQQPPLKQQNTPRLMLSSEQKSQVDSTLNKGGQSKAQAKRGYNTRTKRTK